MLEVEGLAAGYLGERVIDGVDLEVRTGEAVAIVGSNGAGKSTLFRTIAGLLPAIAGSRPAIARKSVVFPAPFEPTIATASPVPTSMSIPSMTRSPR